MPVNIASTRPRRAARARVGDPLAVARAGGDAAVERLRPLGDDPRPAVLDALAEGGAHGERQHARVALAHAHAGVPEHARAAAGQVVRVGGGVDDLGDARLDQRVGAGRLLAGVGARFEGDVGRRAARVVAPLAGVVQGPPLGVGLAEHPVRAHAQHRCAARDDAADHGVGLDTPHAQQGQAGGGVEHGLVEHRLVADGLVADGLVAVGIVAVGLVGNGRHRAV
jgi:hypothetical protein